MNWKIFALTFAALFLGVLSMLAAIRLGDYVLARTGDTTLAMLAPMTVIIVGLALLIGWLSARD